MSIIRQALYAARRMIETERNWFLDNHAIPDERGILDPDDKEILKDYDDVLALVRDAIAAMETPKPVAFITRESMMRLSNGGNDSRGTVPVHRFASAIANRPLYLHPSERKPLTRPEVGDILGKVDRNRGGWLDSLVRAVERAHGIGGGK